MPLDIEATVVELAWMLFGGAILAMLAWRLGVPYAAALVLGGLAVEESHLIALPQRRPRVLLLGFLPPQLFDAAMLLAERDLRVIARHVLVLAAPGPVAPAA